MSLHDLYEQITQQKDFAQQKEIKATLFSVINYLVQQDYDGEAAEWGVQREQLDERFGLRQHHLEAVLQLGITYGVIAEQNGHYQLTEKQTMRGSLREALEHARSSKLGLTNDQVGDQTVKILLDCRQALYTGNKAS